jgi:hypothetical protein
MPGFRFPCSNVGQFRSYICITLRGLRGGLRGIAAAGAGARGAAAGAGARRAAAAGCGLKRSMTSFPMLKLKTGAAAAGIAAAAAAFLLFSASKWRCKTGLSFEVVGSNSLWFGGLSIEAKSSPLS